MTRELSVAINGWFAGRPVGSGAYTDRLAAALRAEFPLDEVRIVSPPGARRAPPGHGWRKVLFEQWRFPRSCATDDVGHVPYWAPPWRSPAPVVVTIHDLVPLIMGEYRIRFLARTYTRLVVRTTRRAAAVLADSRHTASDIRRVLGVEPQRIHVVPLGVAPDPRNADGDESLGRQGLPPDLPDRFGLYLGGFDARKNVGVLIEAWDGVFAATGVPLVIAGDVVAANGGLPTSTETVRYVGGIPEPIKMRLYAAAAVFAYPSQYEGFGLPPLEAMAAGTPVVSSDATSLPEVVGNAGLLVAPTNVRGWTDALTRVLSDEALSQDLARRGRDRAATFTWARTARATRAVYAAVANRERDRAADRRGASR